MNALDPDSELLAEQRRYHVIGLLGRGGFGAVYRARMDGPGGFQKEVAVKLLHDKDPPADVLTRFRDEARLLGLVRHPCVVSVDPPVRLGGRWAVVMELVDGATCDALLRAGPFPASVALEVAAIVGETLYELFQAVDRSGRPLRVLHRDLKPSNVQITPSGLVKLLDFGIARADFASRETSTVAQIGGTPGYIAPERLDGQEDHPADVFSLGVVLYRLVTGQRPPPIAGEAEAPDREQARALEALLADPAVRAVAELSARLRQVDPRSRPRGDEVAHECRVLRARIGGPTLREWARAQVPAAPDAAPDGLVGRTLSETLARPRRGRSLAWGPVVVLGALALGVVAGVVAVGLGGVAIWSFGPPPAPPAAPGPAPDEAPEVAAADEALPPPPPAPEAPAPRPAARPRPRPAPPDAPGAVLRVEGDAAAVSLRCGDRAFAAGQTVPPGRCTALATFGGGTPTNAGSIVVPEGPTVTVTCSSAFQRCRVP